MKYLFLIIIGVLLAFSGLLGYHLYLERKLNNFIVDDNNKTMAEMNLEIGKANSRFGDADQYSKELEGKLAEEIKAHHETLISFGQFKAKVELAGKGNGTSTTTLGKVVEVPAKLSLDKGMLYQANTEHSLNEVQGFNGEYQDFRVKILAAIRPHPSDKLDIPVYFQYMFRFNLAGHIIETITPTGAINNYLELWEVDEKGKKTVPIQLLDYAVVVQDQRQTKLRFAPHLDIGLSATYSTTAVANSSLGVSLLGHGLTDNDLRWRFFRFSFDLGRSANLGFSPVLYNLGDPLPLVSNIWVGPIGTVNMGGDKAIGLVLGAVL